MATSPPRMRTTAMLNAAVLGLWWLGIAVDCLLTKLGTFPIAPGPAYLILGSSLCGTISLVAAWLLYRPRSWSLSFYVLSWSMHIIGFLAVGLPAGDKPAWLVCFYVGALTCAALTLVFGARKELRPYAMAR